MVKAKKFVLINQFSGFPKESDVEIQEEELPEIKDGEFLCESLYISVDPYQRAYPQKTGDVIMGSQVAKIIESKNPEYPVGKHVVGHYGWKTHHILDNSPSRLGIPPKIIPDDLGVNLSHFLGVLGLTGLSAYFGFLKICRPKAGETVVISAAAGAVGSIVGQLAKNRQCKALKESAPEGVDIYFDNVGGEISAIVLKHMKEYGRISVCGSISSYNEKEEIRVPLVQRDMVSKQLKMEGFLIKQFVDYFSEGVYENARWLKQGKLKSKETITKGFENTFQAFTNMLRGKNFGKALVEL
ncbi:hypothetical protein WA026_017510 [Henosepilachna vigintioctopunctata]|uniref:15-oxoprostaglandin 13-reductase n=1 Tax=Henosepilachna vigintioctopunctata TaxID=420089 RepID=A0AAW1V0B6_9CUCU